MYSCNTTLKPTTVHEALNSPDADKWREVMQSEMDTLKLNHSWTLVKPPRCSQLVESMWAFRKKTAPDGCASSYKARLLAKDFQQIKGTDYDDHSHVVLEQSTPHLVCKHEV